MPLAGKKTAKRGILTVMVMPALFIRVRMVATTGLKSQRLLADFLQVVA